MAFIIALLPFTKLVNAASPHQKRFVYDEAKLLTKKEAEKLEALANEQSKDRDTAFIILTVNGTDGKDYVQYVEDYYDDHAPGYDKPNGNTAILFIDMKERNVYLAGFQKAEKYLDNNRLELIRNKITPDISKGKYFQAFSSFIQLSHDYMGYKPGINPDNILFKWWFQLIVSLGVASIIVALMAYRSGGRVTVNARTYLDTNTSRVIRKDDTFIRQTVTKQRKPSNNNKSGGGGGVTRGGFTHSGSGGKF
ncbi:TPM domain-containing protein [Bacillus sp. FJAT-49736]|uniref:TPM domain-containing protein n=1 Tax=Bacillus sp. FJAT-49736 TaxID=2833582 RepID=UPI0032D571E5